MYSANAMVLLKKKQHFAHKAFRKERIFVIVEQAIVASLVIRPY